jgi:hypothetical protein
MGAGTSAFQHGGASVRSCAEGGRSERVRKCNLALQVFDPLGGFPTGQVLGEKLGLVRLDRQFTQGRGLVLVHNGIGRS